MITALQEILNDCKFNFLSGTERDKIRVFRLGTECGV